jgi:hypothetical protein
MIKFHSSAMKLLALALLLAWSAPSSSSQPGLARAQYTYPEEEIHVHDLPVLTAKSQHSFDMLSAAVATILGAKDVCCGKDSALEDSLERADEKSLKDVADRLQGRHLLSDGRPIMVMTEYLTPDQASAGHLITMLAANHVPLIMWNSHVYVVHGISYVESQDMNSGSIVYTTHKFFLWDTRYADSRREVVFDRLSEDVSKVQGLLFLEWKPQ